MKKIIEFVILLLFILIFSFIIMNKEDENLDNSSTSNNSNNEVEETMKIYIKINDQILRANLENNSSAKAFVEKLQEGDITIEMRDYANFEKVGNLGFSLPTNDVNITTSYGDIILYQGNQITIYYDTNTWNFTKLGKIEDVSQKELIDILGDGDVVVTFSLNEN